MSWSYSCPHCRAILNRNETIMLQGTCGSEEIVIGLHPTPGTYRILLPREYEFEPGSRWDFSCPACRKSLVSDVSPDLCCLDMATGNVRHRVYFSRIAGEHATFVISAEGVERFGEHSERHSLEILDLV